MQHSPQIYQVNKQKQQIKTKQPQYNTNIQQPSKIQTINQKQTIKTNKPQTNKTKSKTTTQYIKQNKFKITNNQ